MASVRKSRNSALTHAAMLAVPCTLAAFLAAAAPASVACCLEPTHEEMAPCSVVVTEDGIALDTDDMFRFTGMLPGVSCEGSVSILNATEEPYRVTLSANPPELSEGSADLLEAATFELRSDEGTLSQGALSAIAAEDYVFDLDAGETREVAYNATLPESAGVEVASSAARIQWTWSAVPETEASLAKTGDALGGAAAVACVGAVLSACVTGVSAAMSARRRRKGGLYA